MRKNPRRGGAKSMIMRWALMRSVAPSRWQFAALNDSSLTSAYEASVARAVSCCGFSEATVLDVGALSGLLSLFAARAGAGRVIRCEQLLLSVNVQAKIFAANGYSEKIQVASVLAPVDEDDLITDIQEEESEENEEGDFDEKPIAAAQASMGFHFLHHTMECLPVD